MEAEHAHCKVCVDALRPSQQFSCQDVSCLPGLNQYQAEDKVAYSRTQHIASGQ